MPAVSNTGKGTRTSRVKHGETPSEKYKPETYTNPFEHKDVLPGQCICSREGCQCRPSLGLIIAGIAGCVVAAVSLVLWYFGVELLWSGVAVFLVQWAWTLVWYVNMATLLVHSSCVRFCAMPPLHWPFTIG